MSNRTSYYAKITAEIGLLLLVFLIPLIYSPITLNRFQLIKLTLLRLTILIVFTAFLVRIIESRELRLKRTPLDIPIIVFLLVAAISTVFSISINISLNGIYEGHEGLYTTFGYILLYFLIVNIVRTKRLIKRLVLAMVVPSIIVAAFGIYEHLTGTDKISSLIGWPTFLATYLIIAIPLAFSLFVSSDRNSLQLLLGMMIVALYICLLYTLNRGGWVGFSGGLIFFIFFSTRRKKLIPLGIIFLLITILFSLSKDVKVNSVDLNRPVTQQVLEPLDLKQLTPSQSVAKRASSSLNLEQPDVESRMLIWKKTLKMFTEYPFLGTGIGTFSVVYPKYISSDKFTEYVFNAHNEFLHIAATMGSLGILSYLWLLATFFWIGMNLLRKIQDGYWRNLNVGLISGCVGYTIQNQFNFGVVSVITYFWVTMGLVMILKEELGTEERRKDISYYLLKNLGESKWLKFKLGIYLLLFPTTIFLSATILKPYLADIYFKRGVYYERSRVLDQAIKEYTKATILNPNEELYLV